jgi:hypothetical protein
MKKLLSFFWLLLASTSLATIIPADRIFSWTDNVGVKGGIPDSSLRAVYTNFTSAPTLAQLQGALNSCPSGQVIQLGTWSTTFSGTLDWSGAHTNVIIRGSGTNSTKIFFSSGGYLIHGQNTYDLAQFNNRVNLSASAVAGATTFTIASLPSWIKLNELYMIHQLEDTNFVSLVGVEDKSINGVNQTECRWCQTVNEKRSTAQIVKVVGTNGSGPYTITVDVPLLYSWNVPNFQAQITPAGYTVSSSTHGQSWGIENLYTEWTYSASQATASTMSCVEGCWLKNVFFYNSPGGAHCLMYFCYRISVVDSRFETSHLYLAGQGYGPTMNYGTSYCLVQNNVLRDLHIHAGSSYGGGGHVYGYNILLGTGNDGNIYAGPNSHGSHTFFNLWEGNWCEDQIFFDFIHGSSSHQTLLRNRVKGTHPNESFGTTFSVGNDYYNRSNNYVGNIFGATNSMNHKEDAAPSGSDRGVWALGFESSTSLSYGESVYFDPNSDEVCWVIPVSANASTDIIDSQYMVLPVDTEIVLVGGTAPAGLTIGTHYFVNSPSGQTFKVAATQGGASIDFTTAGSGLTIAAIGAATSADWFTFPPNYEVNFTGSTPGGVTIGTHYFVTQVTASNFKISATSGGSTINITSVGGGNKVQMFDTPTTGSWIRHGNVSIWNTTNFPLDWDSGIADHNVPNSLYLSAKPSWFGSLAWPPFSSENLDTATNVLSYTNIPAGYFWNFNTSPPGIGEHKAYTRNRTGVGSSGGRR